MIRENGRRDLRVESVVRGYHVYKEDWSPNIGDRFGELKLKKQTFMTDMLLLWL